MTRIISVINQKGGVGKTTTTLNLGHAFAIAGKKVLMIDADPQANLSASVGFVDRVQEGVDKVLLDHVAIDDVSVALRENLRFVPAGSRLGEMEFVQEGGAKRGFRLSDALQQVDADFDIILIDCPPSAGLLGMNTLLAARELLIPVASDYLSIQGLSRLMAIINHIENTLERRSRKWLLITRYQERRRLARDVRDKLLEYFPGKVLKTAIRETVALAESPSFGKSIFDYRRLSHGAKDYLSLANELLAPAKSGR